MTRTRWLLLLCLAFAAGLLCALWWNAADRAERDAARVERDACLGELAARRHETIWEALSDGD